MMSDADVLFYLILAYLVVAALVLGVTWRR